MALKAVNTTTESTSAVSKEKKEYKALSLRVPMEWFEALEAYRFEKHYRSNVAVILDAVTALIENNADKKQSK